MNDMNLVDSNQFFEVDTSKREFFKIATVTGAAVLVPGVLLPREARAAIDPITLLTLGLIAASNYIIENIRAELNQSNYRINNELARVKKEIEQALITKSDMAELKMLEDQLSVVKKYEGNNHTFGYSNIPQDKRVIIIPESEIPISQSELSKKSSYSNPDIYVPASRPSIILERDFYGNRMPETNGILLSALQKNETEAGRYYGVNSDYIKTNDKSSEFKKYKRVVHFIQGMENAYNRGAIVTHPDNVVRGYAFKDSIG